MRQLFSAALAIAFAAALAMGTASAQSSDLVEMTSPHSVEVTRQKLEAAIENAGATVFATVDHAGGAASVDLELEPMVLVIFGNPKLGTPMMQDNPRAGLDLPIRVLIWSQDGETRLATLSPDALKARYDLAESDKPLGMMLGAIQKLMGAATAE